MSHRGAVWSAPPGGCYGFPAPGGSSPPRAHADVAQLVEHHLAKVRVAGSSPVIRSEEQGAQSRHSHGGLAERLGTGLQSRLHRFESGTHLGRLAQRERASLTRKRSLVRSQYRPPPPARAPSPDPRATTEGHIQVTIRTRVT